jgi:hypothetical protein
MIFKHQNVRPGQIHKRIVDVCIECAMNAGNVRKRCGLFEEGKTNMPQVSVRAVQ